MPRPIEEPTTAVASLPQIATVHLVEAEMAQGLVEVANLR